MNRRRILVSSTLSILLIVAIVLGISAAPSVGSPITTTGVIPQPGDSRIVTCGLLPQLTLDEVLEHVDAIVIAEVVEIMAPRWGKDSSGESDIIYQDVVLRAERYVFGAPASERLVIRVNGGRIGKTSMIAEMEPVFTLGEESLLFLVRETQMEPVPTGIDPLACYRVALLKLGKYVHADGIASNIEGKRYSVSSIEERVAAIR